MSHMCAVKSKAEMYPLYEAGKFGNKLESWSSVDEYLSSGSPKSVGLRYKGQTGGLWFQSYLKPTEVRAVADRWLTEGAKESLIVVSEAAPDEYIIAQGEVCRYLWGLELRYSTVKTAMRKALATEQHHARGLRAKMLLESWMSPGSLNDLNELLDTYPDAVIEFSTFSIELGSCPHRNTLIWEVRNY